MFKTIIKKRIIQALTLLISVTLLLQLTPAAYAGNTNGGSTPADSATSNATGTGKYFGWYTNIAIFLTNDQNFIMDNAELLVNSDKFTSGNLNTRQTPAWLDKYKEWLNTEGGALSVNKLYAAVFRRTFVSWGSGIVQNSLLLTGGIYGNPANNSTVKWVSHGLNNAFVTPASAHLVSLGEKYATAPWQGFAARVQGHMDAAGGPDGHGVFKDGIVEYMTKYLALRCFEWIDLLVPPAGLKIYSIGWVPSAMHPSPPHDT
jgi:hypothetical protein